MAENSRSSSRRSGRNASASMARRPGAEVVRAWSKSRSPSNSRISSAWRPMVLRLEDQRPSQILRGFFWIFRAMHQPRPRLAPARAVVAFDFAHPLDDRPPKITQRDKRLAGHDPFVQHLPNHRSFPQSARAALARDVAFSKTNELK